MDYILKYYPGINGKQNKKKSHYNSIFPAH